MSEIAKLLVAASLLAAGFFGASLFGPPPVSEPNSVSDQRNAPQLLERIQLESAGLDQRVESSVALGSPIEQAGHWQSSPAGTAPQSGQQHLVAKPASPASGFQLPTITRQATPSSLPAAGESDSRLASLEPPPLLNMQAEATPLRKSTFPQKPTAPLANNAQSIADGWGQVTSPPQPNTVFTAPGSNAWATPAFTAFDEPEADEPELHVVRDGDSLAKLAQRYLGDAGRAREIYELNRDVISHPDLLKIGVKLKIPANPERNQFGQYNTDASANARPVPGQLVPLPELPAGTQAVPRARLLAPVPATVASGG